MEYKGKLYGCVGGTYFDTGHTTAEWDQMATICNANANFRMILKSAFDAGYKVASNQMVHEMKERDRKIAQLEQLNTKPVGNTDLLERARKYLASIKRREHVRIMDGDPTGEYTITLTEMAVFAELVAAEREEAAFLAGRMTHEEVLDNGMSIYYYDYKDFTAYKSRKESK